MRRRVDLDIKAKRKDPDSTSSRILADRPATRYFIDSLSSNKHANERNNIEVLFSHGSTVLVALGLLYEVSRSHLDTPHSVGLPWTSDQPDAQTYA